MANQDGSTVMDRMAAGQTEKTSPGDGLHVIVGAALRPAVTENPSSAQVISHTFLRSLIFKRLLMNCMDRKLNAIAASNAVAWHV